MSNFLLRTVSGIVFLALMVAGMLFYPLAFAALFFVVMYMCLREFLTISLGERWLLQQKLALLTASTVYILSSAIAFYSIDVRWLAVAVIPLIALSASIVLAGNHDTVEDTAMMYLGILYTTLPFALAPFMVVSSSAVASTQTGFWSLPRSRESKVSITKTKKPFMSITPRP